MSPTRAGAWRSFPSRFEPPPDFAPMEFEDLPPPPPDERFYEERPVYAFSDFGPPPPPPPVYYEYDEDDAWRELPPPPPPPAVGALPALEIGDSAVRRGGRLPPL